MFTASGNGRVGRELVCWPVMSLNVGASAGARGSSRGGGGGAARAPASTSKVAKRRRQSKKPPAYRLDAKLKRFWKEQMAQVAAIPKRCVCVCVCVCARTCVGGWIQRRAIAVYSYMLACTLCVGLRMAHRVHAWLSIVPILGSVLFANVPFWVCVLRLRVCERLRALIVGISGPPPRSSRTTTTCPKRASKE